MIGDHVAPSSVVVPPFEPATRSPSVKVRPSAESLKRIASSLTTLCCAGVTSVHLALPDPSNETLEICVPAMYIALPVFQSVPSDGSPAFCRCSTSVVW